MLDVERSGESQYSASSITNVDCHSFLLARSNLPFIFPKWASTWLTPLPPTLSGSPGSAHCHGITRAINVQSLSGQSSFSGTSRPCPHQSSLLDTSPPVPVLAVQNIPHHSVRYHLVFSFYPSYAFPLGRITLRVTRTHRTSSAAPRNGEEWASFHVLSQRSFSVSDRWRNLNCFRQLNRRAADLAVFRLSANQAGRHRL